MIGYLKGHVIDKHEPGKLVLDVNGVGYDVETSLNTFFALDALSHEINLHIHTIVREDALLLYGFLDKTERSLFRTLIKLNGVGPKLALTLLSSLTPDAFIETIVSQDISRLTKLPGVGKKTAERLVVLLKDQFNEAEILSSKAKGGTDSPVRHQQDALSALVSLGFKAQEAQKALNSIDDETLNCEALIRQALKFLSSRT